MSLWASHCMLPGPPPETTHDEPHALLDQLAGQQAAAAVVVRSARCRRRTGRASPAFRRDRSRISGASVCILNARS